MYKALVAGADIKRWTYGSHCVVEGKDFIILDDAEIEHDDSAGNAIRGFVEIIPETLEIKMGNHWFKADEVDSKVSRLIFNLKWMLADLLYKNKLSGMNIEDSEIVKELRELLEELG